MSKIKSTPDGTSFTHNFYLKHKTYSNMYQLENEIYTIESNIRDIKERIFGFAVITPTRKDDETILDVINQLKFDIDAELEELEDEILELYRLNLLKEEMQNEEINKNN